MIIAVCSDKGSPGVTTLATALALMWTGPRVLLEADTSGADLPFRLRKANGDALAPNPSVLSLAADTRRGLPQADLLAHAQPSTIGVPVIPGGLSAEAFLPMRNLWPELAAHAAAWAGIVIVDLGRLQRGHAAMPLARAAQAVLLLGHADLAGMYHLREQVGALSAALGDPARERNALAVVMRAEARETGRARSDARAMLQATGSPIPVAGAVPEDAQSVRAIEAWDGRLKPGKRPLLRAVAELRDQLIAWWPELSMYTGPAAITGGPVPDGPLVSPRAGGRP